jgi:hypothetical protein
MADDTAEPVAGVTGRPTGRLGWEWLARHVSPGAEQPIVRKKSQPDKKQWFSQFMAQRAA